MGRGKRTAVLLGLAFLLTAGQKAAAAEGITIELLDSSARVICGQAEALGVSGLTEHEPDFETRGLVPVAEFSPELQKDGQNLILGAFKDLGEGQVVLSWYLEDPASEEDGGDFYEEYDHWMPPMYCWSSYNLKDGTVEVRETEEFGTDGWMDICGPAGPSRSLLYTLYTETGMEYTWLDAGFHEILSYSAKDSETGYLHMTGPGTGYFSDGENRIFRLDASGGEAAVQEVGIRPYFLPRGLDDAFCGADGKEYLLLRGWNGRFEACMGILDASSGEFARMDPEEEATYYVDGNSLIWPLYAWRKDGDGRVGYRVSVDGRPGVEVLWDGEDMPDCQVLSDGRLLFTRSNWIPWEEGQEDTVSFVEAWLVDGRTGRLLGNLLLEPEEGERLILYLGNGISIPDSDSVLIQASGSDFSEFCLWNPEVSETVEQPSIRLFDWKQAEALELPDDWDPSEFVPGPLPEELTDLKRRAVALGRKYGFRLLISEECRSIYGGYAISPENDRTVVESALDVLEEELGKYPESFFRSLTGGDDSKMEVLMAGHIHGLESETLETAGGFVNNSWELSKLVLDIRSPADLTTTFHHEVSHIIDAKVQELSEWELLGDGDWESLNPVPEEHESCYTYTYTEYGYEDCMEWAYETGSPEEAYFVDGYSMTFPTEDRARLFEYCMCGEYSGWVEWEKAPHLMEKLNYYAFCIREVLGDSSWGEVYWERFEEDP